MFDRNEDFEMFFGSIDIRRTIKRRFCQIALSDKKLKSDKTLSNLIRMFNTEF